VGRVSRFIALFASGLAYSAILALVALGFLVLYKATGVLNFAHGDLVTLGTYVALWAITQLHFPIVAGYAFAIFLLFIAGVVVERLAYAPLRSRPPLVVVIATLAAAIVIEGCIAVWQSSNPTSLPSPLGNNVFTLFGAQISYQEVAVVAVSAVVIAGLLFAFHRTSLGRQVRAVAADPKTARLYGVRTRLLSIIAFGASASMACLAGVLVAPLSTVNLTFGFSLMINAFAAAVLGGFGSLGGVVLGAFVIGMIQQVVGGYVFQSYAPALPFIIMFLVLAVRPQGLVAIRTQRL
jgi:branched-chain amino acid transport system permease protein